MSDESKRAFNAVAKEAPLRDKDNTAPKLEPKLAKKQPAPNLAPMGAMGIRRGLQTPAKQQASKRFSLGKPNEMNKEFKFAARTPTEKGHSRGR